MIPVIMEPRCKDDKQWHGLVQSVLGGTMYVDYTRDDNFDAVLESIVDKIVRIVTTPIQQKLLEPFGVSPLLDSSMSSPHFDIPSLTPPGAVLSEFSEFSEKDRKIIVELSEWFEAADVVPSSAVKYASSLLKGGIPSVNKLGRTINKLGVNCLITLFGIKDEVDIDDIVTALTEQGLLSTIETKTLVSAPVPAAAAAKERDTNERGTGRLVRTDIDIREALKLWNVNSNAGVLIYGNIKDWDTSRI